MDLVTNDGEVYKFYLALKFCAFIVSLEEKLVSFLVGILVTLFRRRSWSLSI